MHILPAQVAYVKDNQEITGASTGNYCHSSLFIGGKTHQSKMQEKGDVFNNNLYLFC